MERSDDGASAERPRSCWSVAGLLLAANDALQTRFGVVTVRGELSGVSRASSGHSYFALKDLEGVGALLRCAMFRRAAAWLDFTPADGHQVELRGRLTVYEPRGELQLIVESMQRIGAGTLYEQWLRLRARLQSEGLFDPSRRRPLRRWPRAVGVVTSLSAAALHDVLTTFARRAPQVAVIVYPCQVQGAEAPASIVGALRAAAERGEVDTLLLVRGGGSLEDLWAFSDERVVRAIAASPIPVICGVGHETDVSLADMAADVRAPTPTAAAELAAPAIGEALDRLQALADSLRRCTGHALDRQIQRLDRCAMRLGRPAQSLRAQRQRLDELERRLRRAATGAGDVQRRLLRLQRLRLVASCEQALRRHGAELRAWRQRLDTLDPRRVLARGYAWVTDDAGIPVTGAATLRPGSPLNVQWRDGVAHATVDSLRLDVEAR